MTKQTIYKSGNYKLEFYEGDAAGTYSWDVMYRQSVLASATDR